MSRNVVGRLACVCLIMVAALTIAGCGTTSSSMGNQTATPSLSPGGGTYNSSQTVTVSDATKGAVLYCTTDGTTPTTSSPKCAEPTTVFKTQFLQSIAAASGMAPSAIASAGYTINLNAAATPTFSPAGGGVPPGQSVTIADATSGANIYYTTDGSVPTASSTLYTGPITITSAQTISAIAVASGYSDSGVASAAYTIGQSLAAPAFSLPAGNYSSPQTVTITDSDPNATIYYAINNNMPSASSTSYTVPITVSRTQTISAIAIDARTSSSITTVAYTISSGQTLPAPVFSPASGSTVPVGQTVTLTDTDAAATIYYTTDGTTPTASFSKYTAPVALSTPGTATLQAIAIDAGSSSTVSSATYAVTATGTPAPSFSPASGSTVTVGQTVTLTDTDAAATIYYTMDGSTPTATSTKYTAPITLSTAGLASINAMAIDGASTSAVATSTYTVNAAGSVLSGTVQSGTSPVKGAEVQLYAASQADYGAAAIALGSPVTTDSTGHSACPTTAPRHRAIWSTWLQPGVTPEVESTPPQS